MILSAGRVNCRLFCVSAFRAELFLRVGVHSLACASDCVDGSLACACFSLIRILYNHTRTAGMQDVSVSEASTLAPTSTRNAVQA